MTSPKGRKFSSVDSGGGQGSNAPVDYRVDSGLGILTFQDGTGTNRLDEPFLASFLDALERAETDSSVKAILLRSVEDAFCLGMNLDVLQESLAAQSNRSGSQEGASRADAVALYGQALERIAFGPKPFVCLVEGAVKAGGMGIVAAADIVVADTVRASFELSEVLFGLIPANVLPFLMHQRISPQQARYLVLSAKRLDAVQASSLGIVDEYFSPDLLERGLRNLLKTMMRAEPGALASTKRFIGAHLSSSFGDFRRAAEAELLGLMTRPAVAEGLAAFSAGETPRWFERFKPSTDLSGAWKITQTPSQRNEI